jgi:hypothetical protein
VVERPFSAPRHKENTMADEQDGAPKPGKACWYCGSTDLVRRIEVGQTAEVGRIGLSYLGGGILGIRAVGTEPIRATLCRECGTVVRLWVEVTDRDWSRADPR